MGSHCRNSNPHNLRGVGSHERRKGWEDLLLDAVGDDNEALGDAGVGLVVTPPDRYKRNACDLHIHGVVGDWEVCAVWEAVPAVLRVDVGRLDSAILTSDRDLDVLDAGG